MKKLLAMLLALGLLALCACTSKSNTTAEVPETTTETPSEETEQTDSAKDADTAEGTDETAPSRTTGSSRFPTQSTLRL